MGFCWEKLKPAGLISWAANLLESMKLLKELRDQNGKLNLSNSFYSSTPCLCKLFCEEMENAIMMLSFSWSLSFYHLKS